MINLDDPQIYKKLDPADMVGRLHELPQQCRDAWQKASEFELPADYSGADKVIILGMGGSAIAADLVRSLVASEGRVPIYVHRDYDLPSWLDDKTLVIASSYSGMTEETILSFAQALEMPAKKLVITTGGKLKGMAEERGIPVLDFDYRSQPRAALGYSLAFLLCLFQKLSFIGDKSADMAEMMPLLEKLSQGFGLERAFEHNPAKRLASNLFGRLILIYGAGILSEVAHRWKTQFNENSKAWAFHEVFPELNHNAVVGYEFPKEVAARVFVILLHSSAIHPRIQARYQVTCEILERAGIEHEVVQAEGSCALSQMMSLVLLGDWVSYYLAILHGTDPSSVSVIDYVKERIGFSA